MHHAKENPAALAGASRAKTDLGNINSAEHTDPRDIAQRRLTLKLAAGAGLSVALAAVMVVVALGDGGRP